MRAKLIMDIEGHKKGDIVEIKVCGTDYDLVEDGRHIYSDQLEILPDELRAAPNVVTGPAKALKTPPEKQYGHPEFYKLLEQMAALHSRKNHDYAGTKDPLRNLKSSARLGLDPVTGVLVRLQDKMSRLESFAQQGELLVKDESVEDTLMDLAVYSLLGIILRREGKTNAS